MDMSEWRERARAALDAAPITADSMRRRRRLLRRIGVGLLALLLLYSSYYQVNADEVGVVQRFGRYMRTTGPGAHAKLPFIETVTRVPVQRQLKTEFGFRTTASGVLSEFAQTDVTRAESLMLTGDLNVAVVEWIVQYKVKDPYKYLFRLPSAT